MFILLWGSPSGAYRIPWRRFYKHVAPTGPFGIGYRNNIADAGQNFRTEPIRRFVHVHASSG
jgi:hypothetical protein